MKSRQIVLLQTSTDSGPGTRASGHTWHTAVICVSHPGVWREHHGSYSSPRGSSQRTSTVRSCWNSPCWDATTFWCLFPIVFVQPWEEPIWFCWGNSVQKLAESKSIFVSFWCLIDREQATCWLQLGQLSQPKDIQQEGWFVEIYCFQGEIE